MNLEGKLMEVEDENKKLVAKNAFLVQDNENLKNEKAQLDRELGLVKTSMKGS